MSNIVEAPFKGAGPISLQLMEALQLDMIAAGADPGCAARESYRISDAVREYVSHGKWSPTPDSVVRDDFAELAKIARSLGALKISGAAEVNIRYDWYGLSEKERAPFAAYDELLRLVERHREDWPALAARFEHMAAVVKVSTSNPNFAVLQLWTDTMIQWKRSTGKWPVTTRQEGVLPTAPLYKHVIAMVWALLPSADDDEDEAVRSAAAGAKLFMRALYDLRRGRDPMSA